MMPKKNRFLIDLDILSAVDGPVHIYATDLNNVFLCMNVTARRFFKDIMNTNPDGATIRDFFLENEQAIQLVEAENKLVIKTEQAHLFYNHVELAHSTWIDFLTIKMPIYDDSNKLAGVFGISHYIEKRSALSAYQMGLTKREIDCLSLFLDGVSQKEIGKSLKISSRTVESYLKNVKNKLASETGRDLVEKLKQAKMKTAVNEMFQMTSANLKINKISKTIKEMAKRKKNK